MAAEPMKLNGGGCPTIETIGAFVDGRFKDREREAVADHLASCESCYFVFSEAARFSASAAQTPADVRAFTRRHVVWSVTAGLAAAASILLGVNLFMTTRQATGEVKLPELVAAVGTTRTFDARFSGGFMYAPVRGPVRSGQGGALALSPDLRIVLARIEKDASPQPGPDALRVRGMAALIGGEVDRAVNAFESAARQQPASARVLSDLSAAYLVRAEHSGAAADIANALANANRALEVERLLPEALFNRALALERSRLVEDARAAWQAYLTIDDRSGWADEARAHLQAIANQP
jgi:hypothetical protein